MWEHENRIRAPGPVDSRPDVPDRRPVGLGQPVLPEPSHPDLRAGDRCQRLEHHGWLRRLHLAGQQRFHRSRFVHDGHPGSQARHFAVCRLPGWWFGVRAGGRRAQPGDQANSRYVLRHRHFRCTAVTWHCGDNLDQPDGWQPGYRSSAPHLEPVPAELAVLLSPPWTADPDGCRLRHGSSQQTRTWTFRDSGRRGQGDRSRAADRGL